MDWLEEARLRLRKHRQILFPKDSEFLQDLGALLEGQTHRAAVLWALGLAGETVQALEGKYPGEARPREALEAAWEWAAGHVGMRFAQRKILGCHALAKELQSKEDIALCHAVGQACAVVHTAGHALGYPMYELTAMVHRFGMDACAPAVEARKQAYLDRLAYWGLQEKGGAGEWAPFLKRE